MPPVSNPTPAPSPAQKTSYTKTATHVAIPPKRRPGRPRKHPIIPEPSPILSPPAQVLGKRKASIGALPYTPPAAPLKNALRDSSKRRKTTELPKKVEFVESAVLEDDSEDGRYPAEVEKSLPERRARVSKAKQTGN